MNEQPKILFGQDETIATWFNIDMEMYTDESNKLRFALLATNEKHFFFFLLYTVSTLFANFPREFLDTPIRVLSYVTIVLVKSKLRSARVIFLLRFDSSCVW